MIPRPDSWDEVVDVVVVGSGVAGLVAAVAAADNGSSVLLLEKESLIGGTGGVSGGTLWIPNNHHMLQADGADSKDEAVSYLQAAGDGRAIDARLIEVFVDTAPEMLAYLEEKTPVRVELMANHPDYYLDAGLPGAKKDGRTVVPVPFDARAELPDWADRIMTRSSYLSLGGSSGAVDSNAPFTKGAALVGALLKAALERGVDVRRSTPAAELVVDDGEVIGVRARVDSHDTVIGARQGVVLAAGGFEWNAEMVREMIGYDVQPVSPGANTGDGHIMAMEAGARMGLMASYLGHGAMLDPTITRDGSPVAQMARGVDGGLIVNQHAQPFVSRGQTSSDWARAFGLFDQDGPGYPNQPPCWVIFDDAVKRRTRVLSVKPDDPAPEWIHQAPTIIGLAGKIGLNPETLSQTVRAYNDAASNQTGSGLDTAPFYALQLWPAALGTYGGCCTNGDGQVLGYRRSTIGGLYAAGGTSAAPLGGAYVASGEPLATGSTFGYRAGRHVSTQPRRQL